MKSAAQLHLQFKRGLIKKVLSGLVGREWYHQRFDGCPYFIENIATSETLFEKRKFIPNTGTLRICFFKNDRADWYIPQQDNIDTTNLFLDLAKTRPNINKEVMKDWEQDEKVFFEVCAEIEKTDLSNLSDRQLIALLDNLKKHARARFTSSSLIDGFALGSDEIVAGMIRDIAIKYNKENEFPKIFSTLTAPVRLSFINYIELDLLKIAAEIAKHPKLKKVVKEKSTFESLKELENYPKLLEKLKNHQKSYYWSKNNYVHNNILSGNDFLKEIKELFEHNLNPQEELTKIKTTPSRNLTEKEKLFTELKISPYLKTLIHLSEDFTYWQDERKRATYYAIHYGSILLEEVAKRTSFTLHQLKYMTQYEVSRIFESPPKKSEINHRLKFCAAYWCQTGKYAGVELITGRQAEEYKTQVLTPKDNRDVTELRGLCASSGKVMGKVRVINSATEAHKVKRGEILVAVMTRPDYVVGMKRAAAIVTNEGGVTSHAAIVSRELGIPCVIGTRVATEVLKDGQIVEVLADQGLVKIVK